MVLTKEERNRSVVFLLNGMNTSLKSIIPIQSEIAKPTLVGSSLSLHFGVLIGFTGDVKGKLILAGDPSVFGAIGEAMFGMAVEGEMLASFSGELGNMLAGNLSTTIIQNGIKTDITAPTIMQGSTALSGYEKALQLSVVFEKIGKLDIYLLLD
ncbi:chemotaxis protein CheX [Oceanobacillus polygoni]|uniref:Chemotaxis protein CheX n=1 Tax=Oceanobacillus polygoni TaxID=1235259 RepID=A0A9X0YU43_9BACI|nr:chemotaxis protein CheX [Oceanobacillus polygoni]MBP2078872.1 chemotaxis protein CheX [Oceanobacillus polygoni]